MNKKYVKKVFSFVCLVCALLLQIISVSADEEDPYGKTIKRIRFEGLVNVPEKKASKLVSSFIGKKLDPVIPDAIQRRLQVSGFFSDVVISLDKILPHGIELVAEVQENPIVGAITVVGAKVLNVPSKISVKKGDPFHHADLAEIKETIKTEYIKKGYINVKIKVDSKQISSGLIEIFIEVDEGLTEVVKEITFEGVAQLTQDPKGGSHLKNLKRSLSQEQKAFTKKGFFDRDKISMDRMAIETYYASQGFIDAKVKDVRVERTVNEKDKTVYVTITYVIEENDRWLYGGITIMGNRIFDTEELEKYFKHLKIGEPVNHVEIERAYLGGLQAMYTNEGYLTNKYVLTPKRDDDKKIVYYTIVIEEHERSYVESITITGNTKTHNNVILRDLALHEGDVYSYGDVLQSFKNLMATGYFESVIPDVKPSTIPGLVDLVFDIKEGKTAQVMFGLSIGGSRDGFPVSGMLTLAETNFMGYGYDARVEAQANQTKATLKTSFYNPRFRDSRWGLGGNLTYEFNKYSTAQDLLFPIFDNDDIPDPYTGVYVYTKGDRAGRAFTAPDGRMEPTEDEIRDLGLMKDYEYYGINNAHKMDYYQHRIAAGGLTGYIYPLFYGMLRFNTGLELGFDYIDYNQDYYRPAYREIRSGAHRWVFNDELWAKLAWDARDNPSNPQNGFILSQRFGLAGGMIGGNRTYLKSQTRVDYHYAFPKIRFTNKEDAWTMNWHFKAHSAFTWIGNQFGLGLRNAKYSYPTLDGMFIGPGWNDYSSPNGRLLWESRVQFSMDIFRSYLYWDTFLDMIFLWADEKAVKNTSLWYRNFYGALATGIRVGIPSFPMGIYLVKRFRVNSPGSSHWINWDPTRSPTFSGPGLDIAIMFSIDMY